TAVSATVSLAPSRLADPKPPPTATTRSGRHAARVLITAGSARGSYPGRSITRAPAARAVAVAAIASAAVAGDVPVCTNTATLRMGAAGAIAGRSSAVATT